MIVTDLEHAGEQGVMTEGLRKAIAFLHQAQGQDLPEGRVELEGSALYARVMTYVTRPLETELTVEGHKKYIDVHCLLAGEETLACAPFGRVRETSSYDEVSDIWLGTLPAGEAHLVRLRPSDVAIVYPVDLHAPGRFSAEAGPVKKIVVKVPVDF